MSSDHRTLPRTERDRLHFVRWVLLLVNAAGAAGIGQLTRKQLHLLLFLSFASSRFYGIEPLRRRATRTALGPYYRPAHIALGELVLSGLIDVKDFTPHASAEHFLFEGNFGVTMSGLEVGRRLRSTHTGEKLYAFLLDLCLGAVEGAWHEELSRERSSRRRLDKVFEQDLTYQQALQRNGMVLFTEESPEDQVTPTLTGLRDIREYLAETTLVNRRDVLTAYQRLLMQKAA